MGCNESKDVKVVSNKPLGGNSVSPQSQQTSKNTKGQKSGKCAIKFTHFGDGGRCEPLLMIFAYAGIEFESEVINPSDWPALKPKTQMGTLPIMQVDSEQLVSSLAMLTYLGGEAGLHAETPVEQGAVDSMIYTIEECRGSELFLSRFLLLTQSMDEETRLAKAKEYKAGPLAKLSEYLESHMTGPWLTSKLTTADFWLYGTMKALTDMFVRDAWSVMGPKVQQWKTKFESIPQIKAYNDANAKPPMKLTYFDVRGRAEPYRMILAHSCLPHEETRVSFDEWGSLKPKTPMGYLPVMQAGDAEITTSLAILKYIGKECDLHGGTDEATCDMLVYTIEDCRSVVFPSRFKIRQQKMEEDEKETKIKEFMEKTLPSFLEYVEKHTTGDKWLMPELSVADFWLYGTMEVIEDSLVPDIWSRVSPRLQAWKQAFEALPRVKAYLDARPKTYVL